MYPWNNSFCATSTYSTRLNAEFGFSGINAAIPLGETIETNSSHSEVVLRQLPLSVTNADKNDDFNHNPSITQIESIEAKPRGKRTRQRTSKTVEMEDKDFELSEIFDVYESSVLDKFLASFAADQYNVRHLFERRTGWQIETRKRKNGRFERFFHHKKSRKTYRSLLMVMMFIKNINSLPQRARPRKKDALVGQSQRATMKRKRKEDYASDMLRARACEMVNDFELQSKRKFMDYFRFTEKRVAGVWN